MRIREIATGLQFPEGPVVLGDGSILLVEIARGTLSRVTMDGRISVVADLGGGPNGAAIGPDGGGLSPDGDTLYYAETAGARVWAYDVAAPGQVRKETWPSPNGGRLVTASPGGHWQRFDSLAIDALGNVCVATLMHGGISIIS